MSSSSSFNMHIIKGPWDDMQAEIKAVQDRATMYALRATGRAFIRGARSAAPVYGGADPRPVPGDLKKSIKAGRTIKRGGGTFELHISPTGSKKKGTAVHRHTSGRGLRGVPLYAPKMEERYGYMQTGFSAGLADARVVFESAYNKAFAKYTI